jgi:hypothetical protein
MFRFHQTTVDACKRVVSYRTRRRLKLRMIAARSHFLVRQRPLPSFLVIGTMRGGTSSLFKYLESHPDTAASLRKEVRYFTRYWDKGLDWYRAHFPITRRRFAFEATPDYLFHPFAPTRAAEILPNAKLIVLLREPLARARSHYDHMVRLGFERRSFTRALEEEDGFVGEALANCEDDERIWQPEFLYHSYLARGHYADQLERWLEVYPVRNFLVLWSEDLFAKRIETLDTIADFLSISPGRFSGVERNYSMPARVERNPKTRRDDPASMPDWAVARFQKENQRLQELLRDRLPAAGLPPWLGDSRLNRLHEVTSVEGHASDEVLWPRGSGQRAM